MLISNMLKQSCNTLIISTLLATTSAYAAIKETGNASIGNINSGGTSFFINRVGKDNSPELVNASFNTNQVQQAINRAANSSNKGGAVHFAAGTYYLGMLDLKSNVRLEIDPNAKIIMTGDVLFNIGRDSSRLQAQIENIEITSTDTSKKFVIDVNKPNPVKGQPLERSAPFRVAYVKNFALNGFLIKDNYTLLPDVFLVADSDNRKVANNSTYNRIPEQGVIQNASATRVATGYALVQLFSGKKVFMRNLFSTGGLTVRLEPGSGYIDRDYLNQAGPNVGSITDIRLQNIRNKAGMASLFMKPHEKIMRNIWVKDLTATDSAFALVVDHSNSVPKGSRGSIRSSSINGKVKLTKTTAASSKSKLADIGYAQHFYLPQSQITELRDAGLALNYGNLKDDPSTERKESYPIAPMLMASAYASNNLYGAQADLNELANEGTAKEDLGRFRINISNASFEGVNLERNESVLYRSQARTMSNSLPKGSFIYK
ncbi:hypothetical protein [Catenovulum maritimum]|uniref:Pectate lyase superfamily protein domain-containing protein n=1 Tax=Catenovulum maritimum TaxID=1513271 RepID=A0A0J8GTJ1_9ALTE|nr:hypothetical protein [Catenovulum maritimum]KMT66080.1 hypothetical protein XM47_06460 [Catenovulum maritimum]